MENKKFEELIDLIINENEDKARELFHDIVVEKSREIYENIMAEEMGMEEGMVGQTGRLLDELQADVASEEAGGVEEAEEVDVDFDDEAEEAGDDLTHDLEDEHDAEEGSEDLEDRIVDVEDKLDELMKEFEALMGGNDEEAGDDMGDDMGDDEEEMMAEAGHEGDSDDAVEEDIIAEGTTLTKVKVPAGGDDGANKNSVVAANAGAKGMDSKPVKFSGHNEAVPTGPKGPSNAYAKGEKDVPGAGSFKNVPGGSKAKLENAPKPKHGDDGANKVSPVAKK
jgi:hypothetical protein